MLSKLFTIAAIALTAVHAQTASTFAFTETYPTSGSKPTPKAEWVTEMNAGSIAAAPVLKESGSNGPKQTGSGDTYCDWTFTGCTRATDIVACPKGQWGITYDDGPTQFSSKLYDFLDTTKQKATLFMIGGQVVQYPELVKRAFDSGHELAIHTWSHSYLTTLSNEQIAAELKWTELAIKEVTGVSPRFFRPPYGDIDDRVRDIAKNLGFTPVIWNHDTDDWMLAESTSFKESWVDGNATQWANNAATSTVGGVSLEHDLYEKTVDAAIRILPILQKAYSVTTVGACSGQASYKEGSVPVKNATSSAVPSAASSAGISSGIAGPSSAGPNSSSAASSSGVIAAGSASQAALDSGAAGVAKPVFATLALVAVAASYLA
ncbi:chitin deacetylase [Phycomyces blakesleeanus]|uniref:Chitin deacetylase n=2 Tax=Phycomyces blakesleeanus TaxID=4837 RepID=A0A167RDZ8_PHYB8|nr:chitin deacetylase [Phycomyces blakesleeanus NRRL 1555(-)]OAD81437.1 chitin deacetylase [Phycomyces blakesleeanus NRRL 1555(-)]|eukprot:XP_018299477.1 chitin deacetylase [Phycomyces blakesleeanus NRRL 1555(-)]